MSVFHSYSLWFNSHLRLDTLDPFFCHKGWWTTDRMSTALSNSTSNPYIIICHKGWWTTDRTSTALSNSTSNPYIINIYVIIYCILGLERKKKTTKWMLIIVGKKYSYLTRQKSLVIYMYLLKSSDKHNKVVLYSHNRIPK